MTVEQTSEMLRPLIEKLDGLVERVTRVETKLDELFRQLFGDGQAGELASLRKKVSRLEKLCWLAGGVLATLSAKDGLPVLTKLFG